MSFDILPEDNIFKPMLDFCFSGPLKENGFDEEAYQKLHKQLIDKGPEHFVAFLHNTLCIYPVVNDFLVKCLSIANRNRDYFDT
jgi:hypothetical protein